MDFNFLNSLYKKLFDFGMKILYTFSFFSRNTRKMILHGKCRFRKYYSGEIAFIDKRIYSNTSEQVIFPFLKGCNIICWSKSGEVIEISDTKFHNVINFGICKNTYRNENVSLEEIINFCLLPKKIGKIRITLYPWENKDPYIIDKESALSLN